MSATQSLLISKIDELQSLVGTFVDTTTVRGQWQFSGGELNVKGTSGESGAEGRYKHVCTLPDEAIFESAPNPFGLSQRVKLRQRDNEVSAILECKENANDLHWEFISSYNLVSDTYGHLAMNWDSEVVQMANAMATLLRQDPDFECISHLSLVVHICGTLDLQGGLLRLASSSFDASNTHALQEWRRLFRHTFTFDSPNTKRPYSSPGQDIDTARSSTEATSFDKRYDSDVRAQFIQMHDRDACAVKRVEEMLVDADPAKAHDQWAPAEVCPICHLDTFMNARTRRTASADEPETAIYTCTNPAHPKYTKNYR